jgi:CDP-glucose 4,6-dehydratase
MGPMVAFDPSFFRGKRVLVTGDSGFKGSWLSLCLWRWGAQVAGYSLPPYTQGDHFVAARLSEKVRHVDGDLADRSALTRVFEATAPEMVFHLAAQPLVRASYHDPVGTFRTNVQGSVNVLECVRESETVRAVVYVTSDKCYRNREWVWGYRETDELGGRDPYSASKAAAELVFESYTASFFADRPGLGAASVRAGNVIGGGDWSEDRIVPDCIRALAAGQPVRIRNPEATRPWQHVLDPLSGYLQLAEALWREPKEFSGAWNFGPAHESQKCVRELAQSVVKQWGSGELSIEPVPGAPHEASFLHLNCDKARNCLGWRPVWDFDTTVGKTVSWYKAAEKEQESLRQIEEFLEARRQG